MMLPIVLIAALSLLAGGASTPGVSVELRSGKPELLVAEPYELRLAIVNGGKEPIAVARELYNVNRILLTTGGEQTECVSVVHGTSGALQVTWETLSPGTERVVAMPAFQCFCKMESAVNCEDWLYRSGRYTLSVVLSHHPKEAESASASQIPERALDGSFDSNSVAITVREPSGVDADALSWARSVGEHPFAINVINKFPTSTYAALAIYGKLSLADTDPLVVQKLMEEGKFPAWNSVPDPSSPDGWTSLAGEELARWQLQQAEQILRDHPGFPYRSQLRLVVGVNKLRLGMEEQGKSVLADLAKDENRAEGAWARAFLELVK